jgi:hypothetical protein
MSTTTEIVIVAFAITNGLRVVAYLPQIIRLARDDSGAAAVSCCTWFLFLVSHISTATYAALVLNEPWMTIVFTANAICSAAIVVLTMLRRRSLSSHSAGSATHRAA